jgi:hypothetical protein
MQSPAFVLNSQRIDNREHSLRNTKKMDAGCLAEFINHRAKRLALWVAQQIGGVTGLDDPNLFQHKNLNANSHSQQ